jgi:O-antigen/teichoic acid export membrane protein
VSVPDPHSRWAYFLNIIWSWLGFAAILFSSLVVMPYLIRRLGTAQYGVWTVAASLVESFWMIDLGFRPATVKLTAEFRALGRTGEINQLLNTAIAYSVLAGGLILVCGWVGAGRIAGVLHVNDPAFPFLLRVVGASWAAGLVFNVFAAALEGFQRFDLSNRAAMLAPLVRGPLSVILVMQGYGLKQMGIALLLGQTCCYIATYLFCRRVFPELRLSPRNIHLRAARQILSYAKQIVSGMIGARFQQGMLPALISRYQSTRSVTYFSQTQRLLDYAADGISRVALVTTPKVTHLQAIGERDNIARLTRTGNRYCLALWCLPAGYLFVFGGSVCRVLVNREFGDQVAVLMPLLLIGYTCWMGQFISASVLMGMARYTTYSVALLVEALLVTGSVALVLPRWGLSGTALVVVCGMIVVRCLLLSRLVCRELQMDQFVFLGQVFGRPLALVVLSVAGLLAVRRFLLPAALRWPPLIAIGILYACLYSLAALWFVLEPEHRSQLWSYLQEKLWRRPAAATPLP